MSDTPQQPAESGRNGPENPAPAAGVPARPRGRKRRAVGRWTRRVLVLVAAIIATVFVTFFTVDIGHISIGGRSLKTLAESYGSKFLDRPLRIGRIVAYITPGKFAIEDMVIEGPTPDARPFWSAKRITFEIPWWTLFREELYLDVRLTGWRMVVERGLDGQAHLPRLTGKGGGGGKFPLKIRGLSVHGDDGEFVYDDHLTPWRVTGPNLKFDLVYASNLKTYVGLAQFSKGLVQIQNFEPMSADFRARFEVNSGLVRLKHLDLLTDGAESHISGFVNFPRWPEQEYRIQSTVDFNRMRELFFAKADFRLSGKGRFNGVFKLFKSGFDLTGLFKSDEAGLGLGKSEWRFPNLEGALQWTPTRFVVSRADSDFLDGRLRLAYGLDSLPTPGAGSTATLTADYSGVDVYRFTRQFGWTALEPQGRMRGQVSMAWHNGQFTETLLGKGASTITPPDGQTIAAPVLPAQADPLPPEQPPFQSYRPFGEFAIGADTAYRFSGSSLDFEPSWVATPTTFVRFHGHARGGEANLPFHVTSHDWQNGDRLFAAIMSNFDHQTAAIEVGGRGTFDGTLTKSFNAPRIEGRFTGDLMRAWGVVWGAVTGDIAIENSYLDLIDGRITYRGGGSILTSGRYALGYRADHGEEINAEILAEGIPLEPLKTAFGLVDWPVDGTLARADLKLRGAYQKPGGSGSMRIEQGTAWGESFDSAGGNLEFGGDGSISLQNVELVKGRGRVTGTATLSWADRTFFVDAASDEKPVPVEEIAAFRFDRAPLTGMLSFKAHGFGSIDLPTWEVSKILIPDLYAGDEGIGALRGDLTLSNKVLTIHELAARSDRLQVGCQGTLALNVVYDAKVNCLFSDTSFDPYFKFIGRDLPYRQVKASGSIDVAGPLKDTTALSVGAHITDASATLFDYDVKSDGPLELAFRGNTFQLVRARISSKDSTDTSLDLHGTADVTTRTLDVDATGQANLAILKTFYPLLSTDGKATLTAKLTGTFDAPVVTGEANIMNGFLRHQSMPQGLRAINGRIVVKAGRISVDGLHAVLGDGPITLTGGIVLSGYRPDEFDLHAIGESMHLRYPEGLQSTVRADLSLLGPVTAPVLSGTVDVLRASYTMRVQPEKGYFGLFSGAVDTGGGEGVAATEDVPSAFPLRLAIKIRAPNPVQFVDNKAANASISGTADVDVSGTIDRPVVTGRIDVDRGEWIFSGNRYKVLSGSIDFTNPLTFDPFFNLTAETRVRTTGQTYVVTMQVAGTRDKLNFNLSSEPWLSELQLVSLLMGETPADVGAAELRALASPQELQAQALSTVGFAIITSPISATVGSAVQRVTTLTAQIVPILGNESNLQQLNPTARIILGKRISDRVYLTYSRTLSGPQNEIILVEFDQNDQISWVLSRNEDRSFALDFRLRYVVR